MKKIYFLLLALAMGITINAQIINFPDANFKAKLLQSSTNFDIARDLNGLPFNIDVNNDGEIEVAEAEQVSWLKISVSSINSLAGISYFANLGRLDSNDNNLTNIDITQNHALYELNCDNNQLTTLDISQNPVFNTLHCSNNSLTTLITGQNSSVKTIFCDNNHLSNLNITQNPNLRSLYATGNQLTSLDVTQNPLLHYLLIQGNLITSIDVSQNALLERLYCNVNALSSIDVSHNPVLKRLLCRANQITTLDVTQNPLLERLDCGNNALLTSLFIKNGSAGSSLEFDVDPNLQYICADDNQLTNIRSSILYYGYTNCEANSYCSFVPGRTYYTIQGNVKYDENSNGCDALDINFPNLRYSISDGTITTGLIANGSGNYAIPVLAGTHTITPVLENPSYFTISPANVVVTFPTQTSPFTQDFCVTANGVHSDLEIVLLPLQRARPGFDASYKLIYKNKGNITQSGTVNLAFNDAVLDLVTSNPAAISMLNDLSWNFTNLAPFETREITFTLNINSPTETPAVNAGDFLNYTTAITSAATDEIPDNNTSILNQRVVNALDPNDKTCLEGEIIAPDKVGDYVHYMIRFENTGTFPAQNIVVKDMIDATKFDVNSLVPMKGSHNFVTRIDGNKVEFIFENINLPFDNANNDGYVVFKIKTKPTLVNGDTFSNSASIYFDYNFPIVTNTATTTIQALSVQDFNFSTYFSLYPNPVHDVLTISTKQSIEITSINIYNTLGQLVLVIPNAKNTKTVDVSSLTSGNYFIKINSDKGTSNTKFIKN